MDRQSNGGIIRSRELSMFHAAKLHGIPNSTLHDLISDKDLDGAFLLMKKKQ